MTVATANHDPAPDPARTPPQASSLDANRGDREQDKSATAPGWPAIGAPTMHGQLTRHSDPSSSDWTTISEYANTLIVAGPDAYKALSDPTRRQILKLLRDDDLPAGAIAEQFDISWPSVSRHLAVLTSAGLVQVTRRGQQLVYSLTTSVLIDIATELADMARINQPDPEASRVAARPTPRLRPHVRRAPS